jgi:pimeloyl-ACP methyl ester carboxylesterase
MTQVTATHAKIARANGINIAYRVRGEGPLLVLIMGYRLSSAAWPARFVEALAKKFTVVAFDNRGTGQSDKPVTGYALANMARDVAALLDEIGIERACVLGYSMGGAIAQEFTRQFPHRVAGLILCATMCGGPRATFADASVVRVMRDLDGYSPEQIARRIWEVTYAPGYLKENREQAEDQMRRETALPTPLHAADLQFQAFAEFDGAKALSQIRCPTLVLTGDLDRLIRPENSKMLAQLIPGAKLVVIADGGHRVLWEAVEKCTDLIDGFLSSTSNNVGAKDVGHQERNSATPHMLVSAAELLTTWPLALARAGSVSLTVARQYMLLNPSRFGDGKPIIILAPRFIGSDLMLLPLSMWLKALGYRPISASFIADQSSDVSLSQAINEITERVGRKAVLISHFFNKTRALRIAEANRSRISDVIVLETPGVSGSNSDRTHFVSSGWSPAFGLIQLPRLLRGIAIELIETPSNTGFLHPKSPKSGLEGH